MPGVMSDIFAPSSELEIAKNLIRVQLDEGRSVSWIMKYWFGPPSLSEGHLKLQIVALTQVVYARGRADAGLGVSTVIS